MENVRVTFTEIQRLIGLSNMSSDEWPEEFSTGKTFTELQRLGKQIYTVLYVSKVKLIMSS